MHEPRSAVDQTEEQQVRSRAQQLIEAREGRRHSVHRSGDGRTTVGIGFDLDRPGAPAKVAAIGAEHAALRSGRAALTDLQIDALLRDDLDDAVSQSRLLVEQFDELPIDDQIVIVDLMFAVGPDAFARWYGVAGAIERDQWMRSYQEGRNGSGDDDGGLRAADEDS